MTFRRRGDLMIQYLDFTKFAVYFMWPVLPCFLCFLTQNFTEITSVSETIRNLPLAKAQTAFKKNKIWQKNDFQYGGLNYYTLQSGTIMTLISPGYCTPQCGMWLWNHHSELTKWQHPAMWYVALGWHAIEFARWHNPTMWHIAQGLWHWICKVAAPCNLAGGYEMTCHGIRPNVCHIGILHLVSILTISPQSICHSAPVCKILSKSYHPQQKKMTLCWFSGWWISAILDFKGQIMCSLKRLCMT